MCKEGSYARLAKYIADVGREVTQVDLIEELPFYKGSESQKRDMLSLAIAYGYKNNIIIRKTYVDDIEFLSGEALKETDLNNVTIAYSQDITTGYEAAKIEYDNHTEYDLSVAGSTWFQVESEAKYGVGKSLPGGEYKANVIAECIAD